MSEQPRVDIEAIKARLAAATPGPWDIGTTTDCSGDTAILAEIRGETTVIAECFAEFIGKDGVVAKNSQRCLATATLIAHAPTDIAALLAEVERLQRERSEWCDRADVLMTEHMTQMRDLTAEVEALRARLTTVPDMRWWHETPYPEDIWTMTTEQYVAAVPDPQLRTAISGYLMRAGWKVAAQTIKEALEEYALLAAGMEEKA